MDQIKIDDVPELNNIIPIFQKKYVKCGDKHVIGHIGPYMVDASSAAVTCGHCKQELSPYWVIEELARAEHRYKRLIQDYKRMKGEAEEKLRTKCEHCNKMTKVRVKGRSW
jgi:hypothetical protein